MDSGKTWTTILPYDSASGQIENGAFLDSEAFVFTYNKPYDYSTKDYGATWTKDTMFKYFQPQSVSFPTPTKAYFLGTDTTSSALVLLVDSIPQPVAVIKPPPNSVSLLPQDEASFTVYSDKSSLNFEVTPPSAEQRTIEVIDLLGRRCASIAVPANSTSSRLALSTLQPGSYFARLGTAVVKFNIWE
jgi:hypothetical protein